MAIKPDISAEFDYNEREVLLRRYEEACQAARFLLSDMNKISKGLVRNPRAFAQESVSGATLFLGPK